MPLLRLCTVEELPSQGKGKRFQPEGLPPVALFLLEGEGELVAVEDRCPHMDAPLHDGLVVRGVVTCNWHMWQFDLRTGDCLLNHRVHLKTWPVRIRNGEVFLASD